MKLKTRTNQPVYYKLPVSSNMEQLSDGMLNSLKVGDVVQKKTGNQKHCYIVTYKEEKHGICLTYVDCGYSETISYDYVGGHWVFNSKDVITDFPTKEFEVVVNSVGGRTFNSSYSKAIIYHGNLYLMINGFLLNETGATISAGTIYFECQLDEDTASKIYDLDGKKLSEANTTTPYQVVLTMPTSTGDNAQNLRSGIISRDGSSKKLRIALYIDNMTAGSSQKISGRTYLLLV